MFPLAKRREKEVSIAAVKMLLGSYIFIRSISHEFSNLDATFATETFGELEYTFVFPLCLLMPIICPQVHLFYCFPTLSSITS